MKWQNYGITSFVRMFMSASSGLVFSEWEFCIFWQVRAGVVGYPNVGKSSLVNRLLKRRMCAAAPRPGVTRELKYVRSSLLFSFAASSLDIWFHEKAHKILIQSVYLFFTFKWQRSDRVVPSSLFHHLILTPFEPLGFPVILTSSIT